VNIQKVIQAKPQIKEGNGKVKVRSERHTPDPSTVLASIPEVWPQNAFKMQLKCCSDANEDDRYIASATVSPDVTNSFNSSR